MVSWILKCVESNILIIYRGPAEHYTLFLQAEQHHHCLVSLPHWRQVFGLQLLKSCQWRLDWDGLWLPVKCNEWLHVCPPLQRRASPCIAIPLFNSGEWSPSGACPARGSWASRTGRRYYHNENCRAVMSQIFTTCLEHKCSQWISENLTMNVCWMYGTIFSDD